MTNVCFHQIAVKVQLDTTFAVEDGAERRPVICRRTAHGRAVDIRDLVPHRLARTLDDHGSMIPVQRCRIGLPQPVSDHGVNKCRLRGQQTYKRQC